MRGSLSLTALAAVVATASGAIIPLNEIRASASAPAPPAGKEPAPDWFVSLLASGDTSSSSTTKGSSAIASSPTIATPTTTISSKTTPSSISSAVPVVTSEITLTPVAAPSYVELYNCFLARR